MGKIGGNWVFSTERQTAKIISLARQGLKNRRVEHDALHRPAPGFLCFRTDCVRHAGTKQHNADGFRCGLRVSSNPAAHAGGNWWFFSDGPRDWLWIWRGIRSLSGSVRLAAL